MFSKRGRKPTDADYGLGEHAIDGDRLGMMDERELTQRLLATFSRPDYRPPRLPAVATQLLALSQRHDVEFAEIETLLEQDAVLAGEVLSVARSSHYSGRRQVTTLREALVRVGLNKLRGIVLQAAMNMRVFRCAAYTHCMERLRHHAQSAAHLCRLISRYTPLDEDQAFLCGLLHDIGFAGILLVLGDTKRGDKPPDLALLWSPIDAVHGRAGARMVELWGLPAEVSMAVGAHHQVLIDRVEHPMSALVCVAEVIAVELDLGFAPAEGAATPELEASGLAIHGRIDRSNALTVDLALRTLGLEESQLDLIRSDARSWVASAGN